MEPKDSATARLRELGAFIREQRNGAELSLRSLAASAGISNPYLSQIERGLRKPSAEILQRVAQALRISAETLYVKAGILEERGDDLAARIRGDRELSERHKRVLLEVYESLRSGEPVSDAAATAPPEDQLSSDAATASLHERPSSDAATASLHERPPGDPPPETQRP